MSVHKNIVPVQQSPLFVCFSNANAVPDSEVCEALKDLNDNLEALKNHITEVKIAPIIQGQLNKIEGADAIKEPLDRLILAFSTTFAVNDQIEPLIEGYPGSHILVNFLARKALGKNATAQSLQMDLFENKIETDENICKMVDVLATYYIDNCMTFKPQKAPKLFWQPPAV
jgi:hypothetical protein